MFIILYAYINLLLASVNYWVLNNRVLIKGN